MESNPVEARDPVTRSRRRPPRGGFYLHYSAKGYSHGCIEIEGRSFLVLRAFIAAMRERRIAGRNCLILRVRYVPGRATNGGTAVSR